MATTTNHYDLIVLGPDVAGLVAAALVARRGKRVLVLPHGQVDGVVRLGSRQLCLDAAPLVHMATPPLRRVFHELGLLQQVRRLHAPIDETVHLVMPQERLDLRPAGQNFAQEVRRVFEGDPVEAAYDLQMRWAQATDAVLDQMLSSDAAMAADGFWARRFLARVAAQLPGREVDELEPLAADHPLRQGLAAPLPWLQHLGSAQLGKAAQLRLCRLWREGPQELVGGMPRLRELLVQRIELHSGEIKRDLRAAELLSKRGKIVGLSLLGKRDRYGCDHMILATDPRRLIDGTFHADALPRPLVQHLAGIQAVAQRFVLHLEVDVRGLSPALTGMVVCTPSRPTDDPSTRDLGHIYVRIGPGPSEELRHLVITRVIGPDEPLDRMRERVLDELDERGVLPFVRRYVRMMHSPHDGREATDGFGSPLREATAAWMMQLPMHPLFHADTEPSLGAGILGPASGIRSLHVASRLSLPGLGLEGEFMAGLLVASLIAAPAKSPFSRSPMLRKA